MTHTIAAIEALSKLSDIDKRRWAYLALTGKLENAVRDQLAFTIQTRNANLLVGRDLAVHAGQGGGAQPKRHDMVVFENDRVVEVMEAKQFWTFDYRPQRGGLSKAVQDAVEADLIRLTALSAHGGDLDVQMLNLVCWCKAELGTTPNFEQITKYRLHRPQIQQTPDHSEAILAILNEQMAGWHFKKPCVLDLGLQYGLRVYLAFIVGSPST